jgi:hypothetical protein
MKEMRRRARAKYFEKTDYIISRGNYLPLGTIVKVKASHPSILCWHFVLKTVSGLIPLTPLTVKLGIGGRMLAVTRF